MVNFLFGLVIWFLFVPIWIFCFYGKIKLTYLHALVDVHHTLMKTVVKPDVFNQVNSSLKSSKLDLRNSENLLPCELMKLSQLQSPHYNSLIYLMKRSDLFERIPNKGLLYWSKRFRNVAHLNIKLHVPHPYSHLVTWYLISKNVSTILTG